MGPGTSWPPSGAGFGPTGNTEAVPTREAGLGTKPSHDSGDRGRGAWEGGTFRVGQGMREQPQRRRWDWVRGSTPTGATEAKASKGKGHQGRAGQSTGAHGHPTAKGHERVFRGP